MKVINYIGSSGEDNLISIAKASLQNCWRLSEITASSDGLNPQISSTEFKPAGYIQLHNYRANWQT